MLICDKRRPRMRRDTNIRPPRGPNKDTPGLRPAPKALPAWGGTPRPPGLRPLARLRAPGPRCLGHPAGGFRARVRRWRGWATACGCPCRRLAPGGFRASGEIQSVGRAVARQGVRGRAPVVRAAVGNPAQAVGGQGAAACGCARRPRTGRGCPRATGLQGTPVW